MINGEIVKFNVVVPVHRMHRCLSQQKAGNCWSQIAGLWRKKGCQGIGIAHIEFGIIVGIRVELETKCCRDVGWKCHLFQRRHYPLL